MYHMTHVRQRVKPVDILISALFYINKYIGEMDVVGTLMCGRRGNALSGYSRVASVYISLGWREIAGSLLLLIGVFHT